MSAERKPQLTTRTTFEFPPYPLLEVGIPQVESMTDERRVLQSLSAYSHLLNSHGELDTIMALYKQDPQAPHQHFVLSQPVFDGKDKLVSKEFILDGDYSFGIGMSRGRNQPTYWGVVTSFESFYEAPKSPLIKQLQFKKETTRKSASANDPDLDNIFKRYRWEFALVNIVTLWADRAGLETVYVQPPGDRYQHNDMGPERAKMRYDVTPRRLGFVMDSTTGAYKLPLTKK